MNFDDIFDKARTAMNIAAKKTNEVVEVSKLKLDAVKLNNEITALYEKLGRSVYQMKQEKYQDESLISSLCEEINELLKKLSELSESIAEKKNEIVCPTCGTINMKDNLYCFKCGTKIQVEFKEDFKNDVPEDSEEDLNTDSEDVTAVETELE